MSLQIGIAVGTGVLVIAATSVAAIIIGSRQTIPTGTPGALPALSSNPARPPSVSPSPEPDPGPGPDATAASATAAPTATPKRTSTGKPSPTPSAPAVTLRSVQCDRAEIALLEKANCTVTLSWTAASDTTVALEADTDDVSMPAAVVVARGTTSAGFVVQGTKSSGGPTTMTARLGTTVVTTAVTVRVVGA